MMKRRHLQIRLVKDPEEGQETNQPREFPFEEVQDLVTIAFIGVAALMVLNTIGKIAVYKVA